MNKDVNVSLYVQMHSTGTQKYNGIRTFILTNGDPDDIHEHTFKCLRTNPCFDGNTIGFGPEDGKGNFISNELCRNYVANDTLVVGCMITGKERITNWCNKCHVFIVVCNFY